MPRRTSILLALLALAAAAPAGAQVELEAPLGG